MAARKKAPKKKATRGRNRYGLGTISLPSGGKKAAVTKKYGSNKSSFSSSLSGRAKKAHATRRKQAAAAKGPKRTKPKATPKTPVAGNMGKRRTGHDRGGPKATTAGALEKIVASARKQGAAKKDRSAAARQAHVTRRAKATASKRSAAAHKAHATRRRNKQAAAGAPGLSVSKGGGGKRGGGGYDRSRAAKKAWATRRRNGWTYPKRGR